MGNNNKKFFIRYLDNQAVKIETHFIGERERGRPLDDVADLIAAFKTAATPLLDKFSIAQLTLHLPVGVSKTALSQDCFATDEENDTTLDGDCYLLNLGSVGSSSKQPLIIKFKNEMKVDFSIPTTFVTPGSIFKQEVTRIDNIDVHIEHLERPKLLARLDELVAGNLFVRLTSPSGSGKSSLLSLYECSLKKIQHDVVWISCLDKRSGVELLREKAGIDLKTEKIFCKRNTCVFLDDAQAKYDDEEFWKLLMKSSQNWLPLNIRFVFSSTHLLAGGIESPTELGSMPYLDRSDFLLSEEESGRFLDFDIIGLPKSIRFPALKSLLINECGGLIGALRLSIDSLKLRFSKDIQPTESALLQYVLSDDFVAYMRRCFGSSHSDPVSDDFKEFLKRIFVDENIEPDQLTDKRDKESYSSLKKAGILVERPGASTFMFSSPLAKRYYFKWIFPNRASANPESLRELVRNVLGSMSSSLLQGSTVGGDFPKEAVFQHLFMEGLARYTKAKCSICPELSKVFPDPNSNLSGSTRVAGEIDFYVNGELRWGIELLINGDDIGEHISRFSCTGKYFALDLHDYAVVDFRRSLSGVPTNVARHEKRITVFFQDNNFRRAQCLFGLDEHVIHVELAD